MAPTATPATGRLSTAEIEHFRREGYVSVADPIFSPAKFAALRAHFDGMLARLPAGTRPEGMDVPHFVDTTLFDWLFDDGLLDVVESILGPDLALFSSHFICKPPGDGKRVPWHEDSAYWGDMLSPMEVVTVWLALDEATAQNGCMRVIPGTHRGGYSDYEPVADPTTNVFGSEIKKHQFDASRAVDIVLKPNHANLHDGRLMHGSNFNTSGERRCGYTMRYVSTRTLLNPNRLDHHCLYLARGRDHAGNVYGDPSKSLNDMMARRTGQVKKGH
ncbi:MAG: phytanoyl-CoA dioxygenase family protein [Planctomycetes bacterium]|nr:phytanoyl-CoA dioxygenase family protein [Planctomycetota bacterium]